MTNKQSNKELVKAGHAFASAMDMDTPIIEIAKLVTKLADRLDVLDACNKSLAAEIVVARKAVKLFCDVVGSNTDAICEEIGSEGVRAILAAMSATGNLPATDAILNSVRAEGVDMFAAHCSDKEHAMDRPWTFAALHAELFASKLRADAAKDGE
ncbi:hypothetical protein [Candidatus Pantoea formicae]|uniref:hypothetical protein n=1 Tax=Candidatus Pantoea formicae TaxID=2608355 RepID=UPI003EDAAEA3